MSDFNHYLLIENYLGNLLGAILQFRLPVLAQLENHHLAGRCIALVGHGINGHQNVGLGEVSGGATDWNIEADDDDHQKS